MKLYYAGFYPDAHFYDYVRAGAKHALISVVDLQSGDGGMTKSKKANLRKMREAGVRLFLDSGAFTAYELKRQGKGEANSVTLKRYTEFVQCYRKYFDVVAALDVIADPETSYLNYVYMRMQGLDFVLPAFHRFEPLSTIDRYVNKCDYMGIGGTATFRTSNKNIKANHIRRAIGRIRERDPKMKVHLYGVMDLVLLRLFATEVESADSSSWMQGQQYGNAINTDATMFVCYWGRIKSKYNHTTAYNVYQIARFIRQLNEYKDKSPLLLRV